MGGSIELIESKGAAHAVAALLAIATGQTTISNHSLITGKNVSKKTEGHVNEYPTTHYFGNPRHNQW